VRFARALSLAMAVAGAVLAARPSPACDSTACLLQTRGNNGVPSRGSWQADVSFRYTDADVGMQGSERADVVRRPWVDFERQHIWPRFHTETGGVDRFYQVDLVYGLGWGSAVQLSLPVYSQRRYSVEHGADPFTYRTHGPGDAVIGLRRVITRSLVGGLSVKLPSGRSDVRDPYGVYVLDPMIQPGTGSFDLAGSLQYGFRLAGMDGTLSGSYQRNWTNTRGYRFGSDAIATASLRHRLAGPVSGSVQVKGMHTGRATFLGQAVPSTGDWIVYLNPGLQVALPVRTSAYAYVPVPVYRDVNEQQLTPKFALLLGVSKAF